MTPKKYSVVSMPSHRAREYAAVAGWGFAFEPDEKDLASIERMVPWDRARGVERSFANLDRTPELVAVNCSYEFQMQVPGGASVATSGLSWVSVHPGHRRKGILRTMISDHFARSAARGEIVSTLTATEPEIYTRFGYGLAFRSVKMTLPRHAHLRDVKGADDLTVSIATASFERHDSFVAAVMDSVVRPSWFGRPGESLRKERFEDRDRARLRKEPLRIVMIEDEGTPLAWALVSRDVSAVGPGIKRGIATVEEHASVNAAASRRLWKVLTDMDLVGSTIVERCATDDPLVHLLRNERDATPQIRDHVWLRILDVKAALEARTYAADADVVFTLTDKEVPANANTWHMSIRDGHATVEHAAVAAVVDVEMNIEDLSAIYLGGIPLTSLIAGGRGRVHSPARTSELSTAFGSPIAPFGNWSF